MESNGICVDASMLWSIWLQRNRIHILSFSETSYFWMEMHLTKSDVTEDGIKGEIGGELEKRLQGFAICPGRMCYLSCR